MNIAYEFSRIKDSFSKVKLDIDFLAKKITDNYENFMREHYKLSSQVKALSEEIKANMQHVKDNHLKEGSTASDKEVEDLKYIVKELREEVEKTQKEHNKVVDTIRDIKDDTKDVKSIKDRLQNSELEIYLLKEKLNEKDQEISQMKEVSSHLFNLVSELASLERELITNSKQRRKK